MNGKWLYRIPVVLTALFIASCGAQSTSQTQSYKDTKTMVLDILQSEDGIKAIREAQHKGSGSDGSGGDKQHIKLLSAEDAQHLQTAVKDVLTDKANNKFLASMMTDPKFAGQFAKAIQNENKQLQKDLMKDPEYQQMMLQLLKTAEAEKMILDVMKSPQYRQQTMSIIQESLQSPLFRMELLTLLKKVIEEEATAPAEKNEKQAGAKQNGQKEGEQGDGNGQENSDGGGKGGNS